MSPDEVQQFEFGEMKCSKCGCTFTSHDDYYVSKFEIWNVEYEWKFKKHLAPRNQWINYCSCGTIVGDTYESTGCIIDVAAVARILIVIEQLLKESWRMKSERERTHGKTDKKETNKKVVAGTTFLTYVSEIRKCEEDRLRNRSAAIGIVPRLRRSSRAARRDAPLRFVPLWISNRARNRQPIGSLDRVPTDFTRRTIHPAAINPLRPRESHSRSKISERLLFFIHRRQSIF